MQKTLSIQIFLHKHWAESPSPSGVEEMVDPGIFPLFSAPDSRPEKQTVRKNKQRNHVTKGKRRASRPRSGEKVQGGQRLEQWVQGRWTGGSSGAKAFEAPKCFL